MFFEVYRLDEMGTRNVGSVLTQLAHWLGDAIMNDRILVFGPESWEQAECNDKTWECYFQSISSCSWKDLPQNYETIEANADVDESHVVLTATRVWWRVHNAEMGKVTIVFQRHVDDQYD